MNAQSDGDTTLSIRPERIVVNPSGDQVDSKLSGKIAELIYLGDHIRARMSVSGNDEFIVKVPNNEHSVSLAEGDEVVVGWRASDCRALDPICLLYTSPSPRDQRGSRMPSSA